MFSLGDDPADGPVRLSELAHRVSECRICPRLVSFREDIARTKRRAYKRWDYWGRPVPSFGDTAARLLIVGLAPGAHGANRTGRMFTGDSSGDFLYSTLYRFGFCTQPASAHVDDGLEMVGAYITAALHCVPPANRPTTSELSNCRPFLVRELQLLRQIRVIVTLGRIAWDAYLAARLKCDLPNPKPKPHFRHLARIDLGDAILIGSYHPSRQNTQTGRLTKEMFDQVFVLARAELS